MGIPLQQDHQIMRGDLKMISKQKWIDDYLDLYLYAQKIKDFEWVQQIIKKLQNADQLYLQEYIRKERMNLWDQLKAVNVQILTLYARIRKENTDNAYTGLLFLQISDLRRVRIQLLTKINEFNKKEKLA